jgi:hypothetical protein
VAAFPQGDDSIHLFEWAKYPLPEPGEHIPHRVVDAFFNRFLFLAFRPIDSIASGGSFFHAFARYTGLLNGIAACWLTALSYHFSLSGVRCKNGSRLAILACSLALTLQVVFGDTTHAIAYNLTLAICLSFVTAVMPLGYILGNPALLYRYNSGDCAYYALVVLSYFTAFGMEIYAVFAWVYFLAGIVCRNLWAIEFASTTDDMNIRRSQFFRNSESDLQDDRTSGLVSEWVLPRLFKPPFMRLLRSRVFTRYGSLFLWYAVFSLIALLFLLGSGRAASIRTNPLAGFSELMEYTIGFMRGFRRNPIFTLWILLIATIGVNSIVLLFCDGLQKCSDKCKSIGARLVAHFQPFWFCLLVNAGYFMILFVAGYKDSRIFVATLESPEFYTGRSILFLSPILYVNLATALRGVAILGDKIRPIIAPFLLFSLLVLLSSSFHFLESVRDRSLVRLQVETAFEMATRSKSDKIELSFCIPDLTNKQGGYPILPAASAAEWYRASYRKIFKYYYNKDFSEKGPVFSLNDKLAGLCGK